MTTYLRPGVFVEETLNPLSAANADTSDAIAAFVGVSSKGGPEGPVLVSSWTQYQALFGDLNGATNNDLGYAVYSFFNNGGSQCYVCRAVPSDAVAASITLLDPDTDGAGPDTAAATLKLTATSPGAWASDPTSANRMFVTVQQRTSPVDGTARFDLTVQLGSGATLVARESFVDLTMDPADGRYAPAIINSATIGSKYVTATPQGTFGTATGNVGNPASISLAPLTGGSDGVATADVVAAAETLDSVPGVLLVNVPGLSDTTKIGSLNTWAAASLNRFLVVDAPKPASTDDAAAVFSAGASFMSALPPSSFLAVYGPWLEMQDPGSTVSGATRLTAPGGAVLGQYARNDVLRGVQKVPAGVGTTVKAIAPFCRFTNTQLDSLNQAGYNVIRTIPGVGLCIMGGRTTDPSTAGKYINVRRTLMYLEASIKNLIQFAVFENNDPTTWETIDAVVSQFLTTFWQGGGLAGTTTGEAFFVTCDDTNNTPVDIAAGNVNVDVGVALESPAEFIVIRIGQYDGTATVTENVSA